MKSKCNAYILIWCLYYLQGTLYESGSYLSQGLMFIIVAVSLYYMFYANSHYALPKVLKVLNLLIVFFSIYGIIVMLFGNGIISIPDYYYLKNIYISLLPVYPFYVYTRKGELNANTIKVWVFVFIALAIVSFYRQHDDAVRRSIERGSNREDFTNNAGYIFLSIVPLIPLFGKKPIIQYSILAVCLFFVLIGMKRGAVLIGAMSMLFFIWGGVKNNSKRQKFWTLLLSLLILGTAYYYVFYLMETSDFFVSRIEQTRMGDSSERDEIYGKLYNHIINDTNPLTLLFGSGADTTLKLGSYAHNDWLEITVNNGILGLLLYLFYWFTFYKTYKQTDESDIKAAIGLYFLIYFTRAFFSMSYNDVMVYASVALGYALAQRDMIKPKKLFSTT